MIMKKLTIAAAVAGALGAGAANAVIMGVPSEGVLVPLGMNGESLDFPGAAHGVGLEVRTGVLLQTPAYVGTDTVINLYTAPNTTPGGYTPPAGMTVHYYMFDERSEHVFDDTFPMTPNDTYLWRVPQNVNNVNIDNWVGYVVFADEAARQGGPATFVMSAEAGIYMNGDNGGWFGNDEVIAVPTVPLADGDDAGGIRIGNEITYSKQILPRIDDVVPLVAGTRYSGAPGATTTIVTGLIPLLGGRSGTSEITHVLWFSENDMTADLDFCDDEEGCVSCTSWTFDEVNMLTYSPSGFIYDGVAGFHEAMTYDSTAGAPPAGPYTGPTAAASVCGVQSAVVGWTPPPATPNLNAMSGIGLAMYEFANRAGVAGVNFQVGLGFNDDMSVTGPMLSNGQFAH